MAFIDTASIMGREPLSICEFDLDFCSQTFGVSPCIATGEKCHNTLGTCKDPDNYTKTTKTYKFTDKGVYTPVGLTAFPAVTKVTYSPTKLEFGKGLGYRSKLSVSFQDFEHHDRGIDPYQSDRTYDTSRGTFFRKLIARNKYYNGRPLRVYNGFNSFRNDRTLPLFPSSTIYPSDKIFPQNQILYDSTINFFSDVDFQTREYIIESVNLKGEKITITAKDILKKLDKERSQAPKQSEGSLKADITNVATSLTLTDAAFADYPASGHIRINDEIISYTGKTSPDTLTGLSRAQYGTTADDHDLDDTVQLCLIYTSMNVVDIIYDLIVTYGGIDSSYIPYDNGATGIDEEWDIERDTYLSYATYSTIISEPEGVNDLLAELTEQSMLMLWWDDKTQKIRLKALTQPTQRQSIKTLNDNVNFIQDSISFKMLEGDRYSQLWVRWNIKDWSQDLKEKDNYSTVYVGANLDSETSDRYGDKRVKEINSRWFASSSQPTTLYTRFAQLYTDAPVEFKAKLDGKDYDLEIGQFVDIESDHFLEPNGSAMKIRAFITEIKDIIPGHSIEVTATSTGFQLGLRYGYITDNTMVDYTSATDAEKEVNGFIAATSSGFPSDEGDAYRII